MLRRPIVRALPRISSTCIRIPHRTFISRPRKGSDGRAVEGLNVRQMAQEREDWERTRHNFLAAGAVAGLISFIYTAWKLKQALANPTKLDSALPHTDPVVAGGRKIVVHDEEGREIVPTGNSTVPQFPRTIELPAYSTPTASPPLPPSADVMPSATPPALIAPPSADPARQATEYTLVGLGLRTVSFLSIQVYVVGYYIATSDIAALQSRLVKKINPIATTLVPGERDQLRNALMDPAEGEETWNELLKEGIPTRSAFRVVPVRDTDFHHLRDGFVRAIQARSGKLVSETTGEGEGVTASAGMSEPATDDFGESMRQFRQIFNRGRVPKKQELVLIRDKDGRLSVIYGSDEHKPHGRQFLGTVNDERISRALWLNYLAGKKVASEPARKSIVEGVMEFVERPVGTVATQVV